MAPTRRSSLDPSFAPRSVAVAELLTIMLEAPEIPARKLLPKPLADGISRRLDEEGAVALVVDRPLLTRHRDDWLAGRLSGRELSEAARAVEAYVRFATELRLFPGTLQGL